MIGTKRRSVSLGSNADDTTFQSKRVTAESSFGGQAVAPPHVGVAVTPSVDMRRAARQDVRALNTEFASWVQSQLQDHPDELWEDGVRDYLTHACDILKQFTDVVNWLKANAGNEGSVSFLGTQSSEKKNPSKANNQESESLPGKFVFGSPSTKAGLTTSPDSRTSGAQTSTHGTTASSAPLSFGLSASSQAQSQSSSTDLTTSWSSGVFSISKSLAPVKTVSFSASRIGVSSNNETVPLTTTASLASSTSSGVFSNSQPLSFGSTPSFTTSWSAGALSKSQTAFTFGNSNSTPSNDNAKDNADEDNEPEQPSSPSLKRSDEKGIVVVHETKCKLYLKSTDPDDKEPWKDKGMGQLFIKCQDGASKGTKESKPIILVRNDVGRIMLNALLYPGIKTNMQKNAIVAIFHTLDDSSGDISYAKAVTRTFLIKTKNEEERNKLVDAIRDHAPAA